MSKRALKKYLDQLDKNGLQDQILDLYERFPQVKQFYNFAFNPKEEKMIGEAKAKIRNEYFPIRRKRPRARRSIAQRYIKMFRKLEMQPALIADLMLFNLETAAAFEDKRNVPDAFYKSMLNSFSEMTVFISLHGMLEQYRSRIISFYQTTQEKEWGFSEGFSRALDLLD